MTEKLDLDILLLDADGNPYMAFWGDPDSTAVFVSATDSLMCNRCHTVKKSVWIDGEGYTVCDECTTLDNADVFQSVTGGSTWHGPR